MSEPPLIDGSLDEAAWLQTVPTSDFTQSRPYPNTEATHRTVLRIGYDDQNLYVGAILFDPAPDSILQQLSVRDRVEIRTSLAFGSAPTTTASTPWRL
jgi:hypothetical protein